MVKKATKTVLSEEPKKTHETLVEEELLQASVIQSELVRELKKLGKSLQTLDQTLNLIKEHEFVEFHSSKWKIFASQIFLGVLFAFWTVFGLVFLSWMTYTFFKDSEMLRGIVDNQLQLRQFDLKEIKEKARADAEGANSVEKAPAESTGSSKR